MRDVFNLADRRPETDGRALKQNGVPIAGLNEITPKKAARTQADERGYIGTLRGVFGGMTPRSITPVMVAQLRDKLAARSGSVQANHHLKTLKHVFKVSTEWGCRAFEPARERYVTDDELAAVYAKALPMVQIAIDLAVLTGLLRGDLLASRRTT